jgi:Golgi SNAP receptor complex protein 2
MRHPRHPHTPPAPAATQPDASELFSHAQALLQLIEHQLQELERSGGSAAAAAAAAAAAMEGGAAAVTPAALTETLNQLSQATAALERLLAGGALREGTWRARVEHLAAEALGARRAVERFLRQTHAARLEARDRGLLFGGAAQRSEAVAVDSSLRERAALLSSHAMLDEVAGAASNVMGALREQRGVLKGAHRRVLDVAASLGVSNSLMKIIERRTVGDRVLVYGGSAFILLLLVAVWWFR